MTGADENRQRFQKLIELGIALSAERDHDRLMEMILLGAKELSNADGGTLYLKDEDNRLRFVIMRTDSLNIALGGTTGKGIVLPPVVLYDEQTGAPNYTNVAAAAALDGRTINISDAYESEEFDFSGTREFDEGTGYRSTSFLTVPLKNHDGDVIGVLQLLNAQDPGGAVVPFAEDIQPLIEALASQAAVAMDNQQLIDAQKALLDSFIELIAGAIDAKSPYTGGHCERVPELTEMLCKAACQSSAPPFAEFDLDEEGWYELHIAGWLHDCGKVTTPEYVVDKATKLETIYNRIHEIRTRFEVIKRDLEIAYLKARLDGADDAPASRKGLDKELARLDADFAFIAECNVGGEFMADELVERVKRVADLKWMRTLDDRLGLSKDEMAQKERTPEKSLPAEESLLADKDEHRVPRSSPGVHGEENPFGFRMDVPEDVANGGEVYNLCIGRGTLNAEERFIINDHIVQTIVMLGQLPFPKHLRRVPEYAGGHHEKMDGTGYPRRIPAAEMSIPARIMAVADIFEALTAADRPYKKAKTLTESLRIMSFMRKDQHIDPDIFELFLTSGVYKEYADKFLQSEQIDDVDIGDYLDQATG